MTRSSIGLALSGGGARGIAHIGVLRVFEREGIPIDYLSGTSMGGIIAAGFASGFSSKQMEEIAKTTTQKHGILHLADPGVPNGGVIRGERLLAYFKQIFGEREFSDLQIPLALVAVDLNSHQEVVFREGPVSEAIRATISIPGVFRPFESQGRRLVDGGVLNNLPIDATLKMGAAQVIAVDIGVSSQASFGSWVTSRRWIPKSLSCTLSTLEETLYCLRIVEQENKLREYPPSLLIRPKLPTGVNSFIGYNRVQELIAAGERAGDETIDQILKLYR